MTPATKAREPVDPNVFLKGVFIGAIAGYILSVILLIFIELSWIEGRLVFAGSMTFGLFYGIVQGLRSYWSIKILAVFLVLVVIALWVVPIIAYNSDNPAFTQ